jgi:hypothetical protein
MKSASSSATGPGDDASIARDPSAANLRTVFIAQCALATVAFLIFFYSPVIWISDSIYSMLTAQSIIEYGTPDLSAYTIPKFRPAIPAGMLAADRDNAYQLGIINGKVLYFYAHGTSILSVPFVGAMKIFGVSPATSDHVFYFGGEVLIQKLLAAALMAILACIFFRTALLMLNLRWSLVVAIGAAFGTQVWSTASSSMWSHTWEIFLAGCVVYLMLRAERRGQKRAPLSFAAVAVLLGLMFFVRPTGAVLIACVTIYVLCARRGDFIPYAIAGAVCLALYAGYTKTVFGSVIPDYYREPLAFSTLGIGLERNLISPSRGLFVYVPAAAFVLYLVARHWKNLQHKPLAIMALATIGGLLIVVSSWWLWWAGICYGPRLLTDAIPWFVLLAILGCAAIPPERRSLVSNPALAIGALLLAISIAMNARGALARETAQWALMGPIEVHALEWSDPQFLAGLVPGHPRQAIPR